MPDRAADPLSCSVSSTSRRHATTILTACALAAAPVLGACRGTPEALGRGPAAQQRAGHLFGALASRFTNVGRDEKFATARGRLVKNALTPSRVFGDTAVWNGGTQATRTLTLTGALVGDRYLLSSDPRAPSPVRPGGGRHYMALTRLGPEEFRWQADVDFSLGASGAENVGALVEALLTSADGLTEREVRTLYRTAFPRTTTALGLLASIDSLRVVRGGDGSTLLTMTILLSPERIGRRYPALAQYLKRYVQEGRLWYNITDADGATWMRTDARDNRIRVQLRTANGELVPLSGPAKAMPDTLFFTGDIFAKAKIFTVGTKNLQVQLVRSRGEGTRAWTFTARKEPQWQLPLITERLLRTPLARPFAGRGMLFHLALRDVNGVTLLERRTEVAVKESAILRFLGNFSSTIAGDFNQRVELEESRFMREVFSAMGADAQALVR